MKRTNIISKTFMSFLVIGFLLGSVLSLIIPLFQKKLIDYAVNDGSTISFKDLSIMIGISLLIYIFNFYFIEYFREVFIFKTNAKIKRSLFKKGVNMAPGDYMSIDDGLLFNVFTNDTDIYSSTKVKYIVSVYAQSIFIAIILGIMFFINRNMTLMVLVLVPIYALSLKINMKRVFVASQNAILAQDSAIGTLKNFISNISSMDSKDHDFYMDYFSNSIDNWIDKKIKFGFWKAFVQRLPVIISIVSPLVILWYGASFVKSGVITLGTLLMFNQYMMMLFSPINVLSTSLVENKGIKPSEDRILNFLNFKSNLDDAYSELYSNGNKIALQKGSISAPNGKELYSGDFILPTKGLYIIKGANGTGKSTLLNLISGLGNKMQIDGVSLSIPREFYDNVAYLRYPLFFFDETVDENIKVGEKGEILNIFDLPDINKMISAGSLNLSSGEAQKIAITRLINLNKKHLFLDEPTSNLEKKAVISLGEYLKERKKDGLVILIMHDETYDDISDGFIKIEDGKIWADKKEELCLDL